MQIVVFLFALTTIVGGFTAWRRSPLYSLKATFQMIGILLLLIGMIAGGSMLILSEPVSRSPILQGALALVAILVVSSGASVLIVRITDRHVASLPMNAQLVNFHQHKALRWIGRLGILLLLCAVTALVLPEGWSVLPLGIGGFTLLVVGPMLSLYFMMARRNDRGMSAIIANPWVHWQYSTEQWQAWAENQKQWEVKREGPWSWKRAWLFVLLCTSCLGIGSYFSGGTRALQIWIFGASSALLLIAILLAYWFKSTNFDRRCRRLLSARPEAYLGSEGVFCNGQYTPWILSGKFLIKAGVDPAAGIPAAEKVLVLVFESFTGGESVQVAQRIPIPDDRFGFRAGDSAGDLSILQREIGATCKTASVNLIA
jgi:hypothetical protein